MRGQGPHDPGVLATPAFVLRPILDDPCGGSAPRPRASGPHLHADRERRRHVKAPRVAANPAPCSSTLQSNPTGRRRGQYSRLPIRHVGNRIPPGPARGL
eukprot:1182911-Prorocentrum_minimum.AAC.1